MKQRGLKKIIYAVLCVGLFFSTGCGNEKSSDNKETSQLITTEEKITEITTEAKKETTELTTEEVKSEFVKDLLLSSKFYMPGVQGYFLSEYTFSEDGTVEEGTSDYNPDNVSINNSYSYTIDEDNRTVTIDFNGYARTYEYAESLGGFISDYDAGDDPMAPPSNYEFALIPFDRMPTNDELMNVYKGYMEYYEGPIEDSMPEETSEVQAGTEEYPYVNFSFEQLSWNGLENSSFVCVESELSIIVMVTDGEGGVMYSFNSVENPEAHVTYTIRPTDVSNNVVVGGLNIIDPNADMIYMGLYEENGYKYIDVYDVEMQTHTYYKESN